MLRILPVLSLQARWHWDIPTLAGGEGNGTFARRAMKHPFTLVGSLIPTLLSAQALVWDAPQDVAPENSGALRPRVVVNADGNPVVLWTRSSTLGCFVSVGSDAGFGPSVRLNPEDLDIAAADWHGPALAAHGSTVAVAFKGLPEDTAPCYLIQSTDGGYNWGDTLRVDPLDGLVSRFPSVAVKADGSPVVEYMQFTSGYLEPRHVVRTWMGGSFMPAVQVSAPFAPGEVCDCCTGEVTASGNGVVALYRNAGGNIRTVWGASSVDGGMGFPVGAEVDNTNWSLAACPSSGPDLYFAGDSIRYVWMSGEDNGIKVFLGSAQAGTLALGPQGNVHAFQPSALQQNFPRIAGSGDTLGVVWEQLSAGQREVLFAYSTSGIAGLGIPDTVNVTLTGMQETPDIAYADGVFHIVWSEPSNGQVRYRRAELSDGTAMGEMPVTTMRVHFDPLELAIVVIGIQPELIRLWDTSGRMLLSSADGSLRVTIGDFAPGCYLVEAVDDDGVAHTARFIKDM